jgi:hypothetical protein
MGQYMLFIIVPWFFLFHGVSDLKQASYARQNRFKSGEESAWAITRARKGLNIILIIYRINSMSKYLRKVIE